MLLWVFLGHCATADRVRHNLMRRMKDIHPINNNAWHSFC
jgi:hypothetical protein